MFFQAQGMQAKLQNKENKVQRKGERKVKGREQAEQTGKKVRE